MQCLISDKLLRLYHLDNLGAVLGFCEGPVVQVEDLQVVGEQVGQGEGGHLSNWICILIMDQYFDQN